jgi:hypothetical protein
MIQIFTHRTQLQGSIHSSTIAHNNHRHSTSHHHIHSLGSLGNLLSHHCRMKKRDYGGGISDNQVRDKQD